MINSLKVQLFVNQEIIHQETFLKTINRAKIFLKMIQFAIFTQKLSIQYLSLLSN